jgi:hypothetical protein
VRVNRSVLCSSVLFALALGAISSAAHSQDGCTKDADCKDDRVCNAEQQCVDPNSTASKVAELIKLAGQAEKVVEAVQAAREARKHPADSGDQPAPAPALKQHARKHARTVNPPAPVTYWPAPTVATVCATPIGMCRMMQPVPQGSSCGCITPRGPVAGIAR